MYLFNFVVCSFKLIEAEILSLPEPINTEFSRLSRTETKLSLNISLIRIGLELVYVGFPVYRPFENRVSTSPQGAFS